MTAAVVESAMNTSDERTDMDQSTDTRETETAIVTLEKMKKVNLTVVAEDVMRKVVHKVIYIDSIKNCEVDICMLLI